MPTEHYEEAMARSKKLKEDALAAHWALDDMDEEEYM